MPSSSVQALEQLVTEFDATGPRSPSSSSRKRVRLLSIKREDPP